MSGSLYEALGVAPDADADALRRAYKAAALKHHPDKGGDTDKFKRAAEAYATLSDPTKRRMYDATGEADLAGFDRDALDQGLWPFIGHDTMVM